MTTTGYTDTFNRTVSGGLGVADSGQAYTVVGTASQYSVAPGAATIAPTSVADRYGYLDLQTADVDISGQVALTAVPASNLATAGFVVKMSANTQYYYNATMMVSTGGAVSLRFSKVVAGALSTIATISTGYTYSANLFFNLRVSVYWSPLLQANVLQSKLWTLNQTQPGGWMATATDASITPYLAGTNVGIFGRDESTVSGAVTMKYQNVASNSYHLPMPAATDTPCADPAISYPDQTALQSLAAAADAAMVAIDPSVSLAGLYPRVRVSASNASIPQAAPYLTFDTTEFNVGTSTNLGYDNEAIYLPVGVWLVTFEAQLVEASSTWFQLSLSAATTVAGAPNYLMNFRSNPTHTNDSGVGGTCHASVTVYSTDPTNPIRYLPSLSSGTGSKYTATYMALTAIKISDYFA